MGNYGKMDKTYNGLPNVNIKMKNEEDPSSFETGRNIALPPDVPMLAPNTNYCICRGRVLMTLQEAEPSNMIGCDFCEEWYHPKCIRLSIRQVNKAMKEKWACHRCDADKLAGRKIGSSTRIVKQNQNSLPVNAKNPVGNA